LHDHFDLCGDFGIQGVHLNTRNRMVPSGSKAFGVAPVIRLRKFVKRKKLWIMFF